MLVDAGAEALILPAAWVQGEGKLEHWTTLLRARAIENTVVVAAAAQCGTHYVGHSLVVDASGSIVDEAGDDPVILRSDLDFDDVAHVRRQNPSLANRRIRSPRCTNTSFPDQTGISCLKREAIHDLHRWIKA